jgi:hypothetical protein
MRLKTLLVFSTRDELLSNCITSEMFKENKSNLNKSNFILLLNFSMLQHLGKQSKKGSLLSATSLAV